MKIYENSLVRHTRPREEEPLHASHDAPAEKSMPTGPVRTSSHVSRDAVEFALGQTLRKSQASREQTATRIL